MMAENVTPIFSPNAEKIKEHLNYLFGNIPAPYHDGLIEISILNVSKYFNVRDIDGATEQAINWNNQGKNVYTCPAVLSPDLLDGMEKRKQLDISKGVVKKSYRAEGEDFYCSAHVWVDVDEIPESKISDLKRKYTICPPDYYVKTSTSPPHGDIQEKRIGVHLWWSIGDLIDIFEADKMELANKHLIANLMGDKGTHNRTRLMRLGGTISYPKKDYRVTEMVVCQMTDNQAAWSLNDIINSYPLIQEKPLFEPAQEYKSKNNNSGSIFKVRDEWSLDDIQSMLNVVNSDGIYDDWLSIGMALKDHGVPFEIYDAWCSNGTKYAGTIATRKKWDSFKRNGRTIGTLYYHAKNSGWEPTNKWIQKTTHIPDIRNMVDKFNPQTGEIIIPSDKEEIKILPLLYADDIQPVTRCTDFVEDVLRDNEFSVIYGASNCGKTFFMLDLAMHVALGRPWRGKEVQQGGVIYAALEGGHGTRNRIVAFKNHYQINEKIPLAIIPSNINFLDAKTDMPAFLDTINIAKRQIGNVRLIVIDTLARAISGGDENSGQDMGQLIINADKLREFTNAHIAFVHHSGKDDFKGARGHSSLRAAVDTEIEISRPDTESPSTIKIVKQREMEMIEDMSFSLNRVVLGVNERGKEVTSCVVSPCDLVEKRATIKMNPIQTFMYDAILDCIEKFGQIRFVQKDMPNVLSIRYDELREVLELRGLKGMMQQEKKSTAEQVKSATQSARISLKKMGKINFNGVYLWLVN